jgi:hypothetical protein
MVAYKYHNAYNWRGYDKTTRINTKFTKRKVRGN